MKLNWRRMGWMIYHFSIVGAALMLAGVTFLRFISEQQINGYYRALFPDMIHGTAYRPFVTRALVPMLVRCIILLIPPDWRTAINDSNWQLAYSWEREYLSEYLVTSALMYAALVGFFFALKYLLQSFHEFPRFFMDVICLFSLGILPAFFRYYSYIYDFPTLFLFTYGLGLMARRKWGLYMVIFALATVNKETTILLTAIFALYFFNKEEILASKLFKQLLTIQVTIFLVVRTWLAWMFRNAPGSTVEFHFNDHNLALFHQFPSIMGILLAAAMLFLVFYKWNEKPAFLRIGFLVVVSTLLVTTLFFGFLDEFRDYYEALPLFIALATYSLAHIPLLRPRATLTSAV